VDERDANTYLVSEKNMEDMDENTITYQRRMGLRGMTTILAHYQKRM
jgi:hypothetical protein